MGTNKPAQFAIRAGDLHVKIRRMFEQNAQNMKVLYVTRKRNARHKGPKQRTPSDNSQKKQEVHLLPQMHFPEISGGHDIMLTPLRHPKYNARAAFVSMEKFFT